MVEAPPKATIALGASVRNGAARCDPADVRTAAPLGEQPLPDPARREATLVLLPPRRRSATTFSMHASDSDEAELFRAIAESGARALLIGRAKDAEDIRMLEALRAKGQP
jgi:hypothetical protein